MKKTRALTALIITAVMMIGGCGNTEKAPAETTTTAAETTVPVTEAVREVDYGEMRDIDIHTLVGEMKTGWNLGNTMDALGGETEWGNPKTTHEMIDAVAAAGFNVIRIPTTWGEKMVEGDIVPDEWMNRVHEIVDYAFDNNMYVILNTHHETSWIKPAPDELDSFLPKFRALWKQIAESFEKYGDHLLFEGLNEPRIEGGVNEWNGGTAEGREALNVLNKAFVDTVRATGGNNAKRGLLITTFAASISKKTLEELAIPDDDRVIVSLHAYTPYSYTYNSGESWEVFVCDSYVEKEIDNVFGLVDEYLTSKNIPVIITEYGSVSKAEKVGGKRNDDENVKWVKYYLSRAKKSGIPCIWWDNGLYRGNGELFGIFNRKSLQWYLPDLVDAIMSVYK